MVVYDVTKRPTFENVVKWLKELKANAEPDIIVMLVGNKIDLCGDNPQAREVSQEEAQQLADEHKAHFEETSATRNINVKDTFQFLMQSILNTHS